MEKKPREKETEKTKFFLWSKEEKLVSQKFKKIFSTKEFDIKKHRD